jgi:hypothetical protein
MNHLMNRLFSWLMWAGTLFANPFTNPIQFPLSFNQPSSREKVHDIGGFDFHFIQVTGPVSYSNPGGIPITASLFGLRALEWAVPVVCSNGAHDVSMDTSGNVHVFVSTTGVEVANAVNLSGEVYFILGAGVR